MKQAILIIAVMFVILNLPAFGQGATRSWSLGVAAEGAVPTGDFNTFSSFGIGGIASGVFNVDPNFSATLKSGYVRFSGKDYNFGGTTIKTDFGVVPILVGGRYYFMPAAEDMRFYGAADVGLYLLNASASGGGQSASTSESKFGFAPSLGALFKAG